MNNAAQTQVSCTRCPFARLMAHRLSGPLFMVLIVSCAGIYFLPGAWMFAALAVALLAAVGLLGVMVIAPRPKVAAEADE